VTKRELPRVPLYADFAAWRDAAKTLMDAHIGFETAEPWPLTVAAKFHTYRLTDHLDDVVALLGKVTRVSVVTMGVVEKLKNLG